ncbi:PfkB family carbohydrate kinase [Pseudactinotalea sp. HY158]|uniref:PfkB family carbohydrate kinase n=1 Tax=Pseudactinotalea sp. HY158 TaxID=2654547 RepID=UPI00129CD246|nr:PfkB family carbohydrate kinase [Pseudactinotalea sp. HY158]QGH69655.1 sugar kinase [Pseudactinotalea sp. HY158]
MTPAGPGRVLHAGQALVDLVLTVPHLPERGGDLFARSADLLAGGGFNVMAAAARDGARVVYLGGHGTGPFGDIVRSALRAEGIEVLAAPEPEDSGFSIAFIEDDAERTFVSTLGAEGLARRADFDAARVGARDVVYVSGYSLVPSPHREVLLGWLPGLPAGARVVVDPGPLVGEAEGAPLAGLMAAAHVWSTNEREARLLARRIGLDAGAGRESLAGDLARELGCAVVLRCGAHGAILAGAEAARHLPAPAVTAIDTNGAGDAHCGVLCAALAAGAGLGEAVERANHAAALAVTRRGPATSPTAAEIEASLRG